MRPLGGFKGGKKKSSLELARHVRRAVCSSRSIAVEACLLQLQGFLLASPSSDPLFVHTTSTCLCLLPSRSLDPGFAYTSKRSQLVGVLDP